MELPTITLAWLKDHGACPRQLRLFRAHFGESAEINEVNAATAIKHKFDLLWLAEHLFLASAWAEYRQAEVCAWAKYRQTQESSMDRWQAGESTWAEYERTDACAWAEYKLTIAGLIIRLAQGSVLATQEAPPTPV